MGVKVLLPTAGLIGTLASVVGVSTSNQRSKKAAKEQATHNLKIEVDEINVKLKCDGRLVESVEQFGRDRPELVFSWSVDLEDGGMARLLEGKSVTKIAKVGFDRGENLKLWPIDKAGIWVDSSWADGALTITYARWIDKLVQLFPGWKIGSYSNSSFLCNWGEVVKTNSNLIYQAGTIFNQGKRFEKVPEKPLKLEIGLSDSCRSISGEKQLECNLKVTNRN